MLAFRTLALICLSGGEHHARSAGGEPEESVSTPSRSACMAGAVLLLLFVILKRAKTPPMFLHFKSF